MKKIILLMLSLIIFCQYCYKYSDFSEIKKCIELKNYFDFNNNRIYLVIYFENKCDRMIRMHPSHLSLVCENKFKFIHVDEYALWQVFFPKPRERKFFYEEFNIESFIKDFGSGQKKFFIQYGPLISNESIIELIPGEKPQIKFIKILKLNFRLGPCL